MTQCIQMQIVCSYEEDIPMEPESITVPSFLVAGMKYQGRIAGNTIPQRWKAFIPRVKGISDITLRDVANGVGSTIITVERDESNGRQSQGLISKLSALFSKVDKS